MQAIITRIVDTTPTTRLFWLARTDGEPWVYKPGQFVTLDLPIAERKSQRLRSYSVANPPLEAAETGEIELCIVRAPGGVGTTYLFDACTVGSMLEVSGPVGVFVLKEEALPERDLVLVSTGTGLAPFRCMAQDAVARGLAFKSITLIHGTRKAEDLLYAAELEALCARDGRVKFIPTLSRAEEDETWQGRRGYVHGVYEPLHAGWERPLYYLCGWRNMVDEARKRLVALGCDPKTDIKLELYG